MMAGYRYGGTEFDANRTLATPKPRRPKAAVAACETLGGVARHRRIGEPVCDKCGAFMRAYKKEWRARVKARKAAA